MTRASDESPVFVCRETAARRLEISSDTFDVWVSSGFLPRAHVDRGQIKRWHWPTIEQALVGRKPVQESDPFMEGIRNAKGARRAFA